MDNSYDLCAPLQLSVNGCTLICVALLALPSLAPPRDRLPTHSLGEAQMCDFWQAGISSKHIIWHFLPSLGKQINQVETNLHGLVPVVSVVFINVILNTTHAIKPLVILTLPM